MRVAGVLTGDRPFSSEASNGGEGSSVNRISQGGVKGAISAWEGRGDSLAPPISSKRILSQRSEGEAIENRRVFTRTTPSTQTIHFLGAVLDLFSEIDVDVHYQLISAIGEESTQLETLDTIASQLTEEQQEKLAGIFHRYQLQERVSLSDFARTRRERASQTLKMIEHAEKTQERQRWIASRLGECSLAVGTVGGIATIASTALNLCAAEGPLTSASLINACGVPASCTCLACFSATGVSATYLGCLLGLSFFVSSLQSPNVKEKIEEILNNPLPRSRGFYKVSEGASNETPSSLRRPAIENME